MVQMPHRILVVDDEPVVADSLKMFLQFDGYTVEVACGGEEALKLFQQTRFDLVITDQQMPGMKGDALIRAIRALSPDTPVIFISAYGEQLRASSKSLGVDEVFEKPFKTDEVRKAVARLLEKT